MTDAQYRNAQNLLSNSSIQAAANALRAGEVTIPDLVAASLERIGEVAHLNAFIDVQGDRALKNAEKEQRLLESGQDKGPLHGIPIGVKDNIDVRGMFTTAGSSILVGNLPAADSHVAAELRRAGAIIVGKNNLHEFAWGGTSDNPHFGTARNPWNTEHIPAGSSGGSGISVATRSVFASIGTDSGGSVRCPAAMNGVTGIRPSIGRVSNHGVFPLAWSLDTVGPLAVSAADTALVLQAISGFDSRDPQSAEIEATEFCGEIRRPLTDVRVGYIIDYSDRDVQPAVAAAFQRALAVLGESGVTVVGVDIPGLESVVDAILVVLGAEAAAVHDSWLKSHSDHYGADVLAQLEAGMSLSAVDYLQAQRVRSHLRGEVAQALLGADVLLTPTMPYTAPRIGQTDVRIDGCVRDTLTHNMIFTAISSITGLPAVSVPMGFDDAGLPIGLQIIAPAFHEVRALAVGDLWQRLTDFHLAQPVVAKPARV